MKTLSFTFAILTIAVSLTGLTRADAEVERGEVLVIDRHPSTTFLLKVNPTTGDKVFVTNFGDPAQGPLGLKPVAVEVAPDGTIFVADSDFGADAHGAIFRVNPNSGERTIVTDFGNTSQGTRGKNPVDLALAADGTILVLDADSESSSFGALFRISSSTGARTLLSDFANSTQGTRADQPTGLAIANDGTIWVIDSGIDRWLLKVSPATGERTTVSRLDTSSQGPILLLPGQVAVGFDGSVFIADAGFGAAGKGALFKVNSDTGQRTLLSDFANAGQGPTGQEPTGVTIGAGGIVLVSDPGAMLVFKVNPNTGARSALFDFLAPQSSALSPLSRPGDLLVVDPLAGAGSNGRLFAVDRGTGGRTLLSEFFDGLTAPGSQPVGVTVAFGEIWVADSNAGTNGRGGLFQIDAATGARTLFSNFGNAAQGAVGANPFAVTPAGLFALAVVDPDAGTNGKGALFRVNRTTGNRILLSDFGNSAQGPLGATPQGVARDASSDTLWVIDSDAGTGGLGALFRIEPASGARTLVSDFGNSAQGPTGGPDFLGIAVGADGVIWIVDPSAGTNNAGVLFRVDPASGNRTRFNDFGNSSQGPIGVDPSGVFVDSAGILWVIDGSAGTSASGALFRVNPLTRSRTLLSNFGNATQGPTGVDPNGVAAIPLPSGSGYSGTWTSLSDHQVGPKKARRSKIKGRIDVTNPGINTAAESTIQFFLSEDEVLDENDLLLAESGVKPLSPGETRAEKLNVQVNGDVRGMFVIAVLDVFNEVPEINEENNVVVSPPLPD